MMPIIRRARPRGDNRGHRNFGIVIDGMRIAGFVTTVLAYAILTSPFGDILRTALALDSQTIHRRPASRKVERAGHPRPPLLTRCTASLPQPTSAATLRMPLPALRCFLMASSTFGGRRGAEFLALRAHAVEPGQDLAAEHRSPLLAKNRRHLNHCAAHRR